MKQYLLIIFSALILIACDTETQSSNKSALADQSPQIIISIDTLNIPMQGDLRNVAWFRNNFYALFETNRKNTSDRFKKMIVFNKKGEVIEDVFLPNEIQNMIYCDLIVSSDSLYVKETQFEESNLVLGEYVADFALTKTKNFPMFEDKAYKIYSVCNGEFGGTIYFQNKNTTKSYEAASPCPIVVNKTDSSYYVTNSNSVLKIQSPGELENSTLNFTTHQGSRFTKGVEILFDTSSFEVDFRIATSFISNKKLLSLYADKQETYVGEIDNKKMKPIFRFPFKFTAYFNQQLADGQQVLTCSFANGENGILIIDDKHFNFYRLAQAPQRR